LVAGGDGKDVVDGGSGRDLTGGPGNDELWARDGYKDTVGGGLGFDRARLDVHLDWRRSIETLF
jgi:hypothetical protein